MIDGLLTSTSRYPVPETIDRLEQAVRQAGNTVFARIDHAANALAAGLTLRPTQVLIFGNANAGTPLMEAAPAIAIDLPLRFLAWEEANGATRVARYDPLWLGARHGLTGQAARLEKLGENLRALAETLL
jgi:uncharacterized protein (DUF302 family)